LDFTGRGAEQELGWGWLAGVRPEDRERCRRVYERAVDLGKPFEREFRLRRRDGEYRWILDRGAPRLLADGGFAGYIGSAIDITERKESVEAIVRNQQHIAALNARLQRAMTETHHRVKNNLQIIAAMVDMQAMEAVD